MFYNAKNCTLALDNTEVHYVQFGTGKRPLVIIPGLGDGLKTVKGMAIPLAVMYQLFAKTHTVYIFSRKNQLEAGYTTRMMASDQAQAMRLLGIENADVMGVSQGGMIAQYIAIDFPQLVNKLVLVVTLARPNECVEHTVGRWIALAKAGDYKGIMLDTAEKSYSEAFQKKYHVFYPLLGLFGKPKSFDRFLIQAESCLGHDSYEKLCTISAPTLVIGGEADQIVSAEASSEIASQIPICKLLMHEKLGHALYEEAPDFCANVLYFLLKDG